MTLTCFPHLRYVLIAPLAALLFSAAAFAQQSAPALRHEAWMAYTRGAHRDAAASLQRSLALQLNSPATLLALMFHHQFRSNYDSAWWYFAKAMESHENPHAVMYAMLGDPLATRFTQNYRFRFEPMFRSVLAKPDPTGTLAAMIYERMGMYYQSIGDIASAKMMYDSMNAITDWIVIGPFENTSMCGFNKVYPPERSIIRSAEYDDRYCGKTSWFAPPAYRMDKWIDFERFFVTVNGVFYAATYVYSPATQRVQLRVGTSGGVKLFVNDATVLQDDREFNNDLDTYIAEAPLQQGWNKVLVKCMSNEITRCNFMLRITDAAGKPVAGLRTSTDEQSYTPVAKTDAVRIPNPFIAYFTKAYAADTTDYASLFLLANCHTRNDDGESAEMALHPVIKKYPTSTLLMTRMMAANIQNGKRDAALALLEQLYTVDSTAPDGLQNKILEAIRNKNLTELDILIPRRLAESTDEEEQYGLRIAHLTSRDNPEWESLAREAHEKFPYNPQFFSIRSSLLEKQSAGITALIALWEKYLTKNYTPTVLSTLASLYEQQNDVARWEKYRTLMQELENETPGFYLNTAERYLARENYDRAEKDVRRALQFCPSASRLYGVLATIERKRGNNDKAISHLRESLRRYPADFETRDQLRELEGKKPVAAVFGSFPVDTAIARAKKSNRFPDDQSAILIDDNKYVIYPEGTFEYRREQLVQILKQEGIDDWKEMNLGRFTTIEKAVTIKKNGTEIRADENNGELVFKQLQEGDFIYLRTKDLYNDGDRFQKHFSHREYFQGTLPMGVTRLAILAPPALKLTFRSLGINREPKTTQTPDGVLYEWQTEDVDAVQTEAMMPSASDVFNHVEISSIPSWSFIGEWYNDITTSKLRSSYEIREKIQELFGGENPGEEKVIERIYRFITDSVRYSLVPFRQSGYVLDAGGSADIRGWRKSLDDVAQFTFTRLSDSYAARTGRPDN
ncbi:MAG: hypothetical protein JNL32_06030, partial [Candidatus Kapabacteria bacterium]|nr:hypothetical protein [Candidatus Kapabacteria bacterium]